MGGGQASGGTDTSFQILLQREGAGTLVGLVLPLGQAPPPPQPCLLACSRPAAQGSPLSEF